ncbi:hypothetical protein ACIQ6K_39975 [Streptomyces sp. NPDC096354]|uniref:hypothetical protein n=1 Tax=Streptomyces sp. NPDC096354 TaxID=3366088 RepID=UPI0037F5EB13
MWVDENARLLDLPSNGPADALVSTYQAHPAQAFGEVVFTGLADGKVLGLMVDQVLVVVDRYPQSLALRVPKKHPPRSRP